jgi:DNA-binding transcriptional regulator YhcF (GntR family)
MGKRGLSLDEKKQKLLEIIHSDRPEPHTLKSIEKLAQKKGVNTQTVKDVLGEMVSDGQVDFDKIGSTNWYWSFPNKDAMAAETELNELRRASESLDVELSAIELRKIELSASRQPSKARTEKLQQLCALRQEKSDWDSKAQDLKANDPAKILKLISQTEICKAGSDRWTDNTFILIKWLKQKFGKSSKECHQMLRITDDFDYLQEFQPGKKKPKTTR